MANYRGQSDERGVRTPKDTRRGVSHKDYYSEIKKSSEAADKRKLKQLRIKGNGKFVKNGSDDRVNGLGYNGFNLEKYPTELDRISYYYGYTTHGGVRLMDVVEQLIKQGRYEEIDLIAERDYNNGLKEEELGMVANIPEFLEAYRKIANKNKR